MTVGAFPGRLIVVSCTHHRGSLREATGAHRLVQRGELLRASAGHEPGHVGPRKAGAGGPFRAERASGEAWYSVQDKARIVALLRALGLERSDTAPMAVLRQIRGRLVRRPPGGAVEVVANGRGSWVGWVDLTTEPVTAAAIGNTARVIRDLNPDILGVVEAENRVVLKHFSDAELRTSGPTPRILFPHLMLIDGNDDRGIDVALLTQAGYPLGAVRSHIDDTDDRGVVFSRDCPEYELRTQAVTVLSSSSTI